jgi:hypothetical protein
MKFLLAGVLLFLPALTVEAGHHEAGELSVVSARCGWMKGESLRDFSNLDEFCGRVAAAGIRIRDVTAAREHLWIEATPELMAALHSGEPATRALLRHWLEQWKAITGYRTAFVVVLDRHFEVAAARATMSGDVVSLR